MCELRKIKLIRNSKKKKVATLYLQKTHKYASGDVKLAAILSSIPSYNL